MKKKKLWKNELIIVECGINKYPASRTLGRHLYNVILPSWRRNNVQMTPFFTSCAVRFRKNTVKTMDFIFVLETVFFLTSSVVCLLPQILSLYFTDLHTNTISSSSNWIKLCIFYPTFFIHFPLGRINIIKYLLRLKE